MDLGVNLLGWDLEHVTAIFSELGLNVEVAESLFNRVTGVPLMSMTYSMGFIELDMLMTDAAEILGENFELIEFNRFFLETGPAPFSIIKKNMNMWIEDSLLQGMKPAA